MRVDLNPAEIDALRNALATRRDDLKDIIGENASDEFRQNAEDELVDVESADQKLWQAQHS